jgi:hypothetical protein
MQEMRAFKYRKRGYLSGVQYLSSGITFKRGFNMRTVITALLVLFFLIPICTTAQEKQQMPVDKIDEIQKLDKLMGDLDNLKVLAEKISKEKYYKCLKAFGDSLFCQCIRDNLSVRTSFENYIMIVVSTKDEIGYQNLNDEDKKMVDMTYGVRENCVNKTAKKKK